MISATIQQLRRRGYAQVDLLYGAEWQLDEEPEHRVASSEFFYKGSARQHAELLRRLSAYHMLAFIGADVIDGAYNPTSVCRRLSLLADFVATGGKSVVLGASYNENPEPRTRAALRALPSNVEICARDPVSHSRLTTTLGRPIRPTADLAFLVSSRVDEQARQAIEWVQQRRSSGQRVIAINANYLQAQSFPELRAALRQLAEQLLMKNYALLLLPHDTRTDEPDRALLLSMIDDIPPNHAPATLMLETASPGEIKAVLAKVDLLFTGRLHALILAMSVGTPSLALAYQGKFAGVMRLFDLKEADFTLSPKGFCSSPSAVLERIDSIWFGRVELREHISARLPHIIELAERNFD